MLSARVIVDEIVVEFYRVLSEERRPWVDSLEAWDRWQNKAPMPADAVRAALRAGGPGAGGGVSPLL